MMSPRPARHLPFLLALALAGCHPGGDRGETARVQEQARAQLEAMEKEVAQTEQTYRAMTNAELEAKLVEQSKLGQEPFNSLAFRELVGRKDVDSESLAATVRSLRDGDALLPLLLLRRLDDRAYRSLPVPMRARVLTNALQRSKTFNAWGIPSLYLEDAALALLECGQAANPELARMLGETRPAPVYGSRERMFYERFRFRLCDYALFFLQRANGRPGFELPHSVEQRDALIAEMRVRLAP